MSFYRTLLAALATVVIASPVFAADDSSANAAKNAAAPAASASTAAPAQQAPAAVQVADASATAQAPAASQSPAASSEPSKVNLNKASAKDLMQVKGMNASKARAIVAYRKKHGDFKSIDDLNNVKGFKKIKPDTMKEIENQLSVE